MYAAMMWWSDADDDADCDDDGDGDDNEGGGRAMFRIKFNRDLPKCIMGYI